MSNLGGLEIAGKSAITFSNFVPKDSELALSFVFRSTDKKKVRRSEFDEDVYHYPYITSVRIAKQRLDSYNLTMQEIDRVISEITGIPLDKLRLIMINMEYFDDESDSFCPHYQNVSDWMLHNGFKDKPERERIVAELFEFEQTEEFEVLRNIVEFSETGSYLILRRIRRFLDNSSENAEVMLEIEELNTSIGPMGSGESETLFSESFDDRQKLSVKYLNAAKVHFTERKFDLVHIELIIAVEYSMNAYLRKTAKEISLRNLRIDSLLKGVSLNDFLKFILLYLEKKPLSPELESCFEKAYSKRNNIIHNGNRRYNTDEAYRAISCCEKIVGIIET